MSHSTHEEKPLISSKAAMMFALIIVGLILGTVNFVKAMGNSEEGHGGGHGEHQTEAAHGTEHGAPAAHGEGQGHEATAPGTTTHENAAPKHEAHDGDTATMAEKAGDHGDAVKH